MIFKELLDFPFRIYEHDGQIYAFRDVDGECQYGVYVRRRVEWRACRQGADFAEVEPYCSEKTIRLFAHKKRAKEQKAREREAVKVTSALRRMWDKFQRRCAA